MRSSSNQVMIAVVVYLGQTVGTVRVNGGCIVSGTLFCLPVLCFLAAIDSWCKVHQLVSATSVVALVIFGVFPIFRLIPTGVVRGISAC